MKRRWKLILLIGLLALLGSVSALQRRVAYSNPSGELAEVAIVQATGSPVSDAEVEALVRQAVALAGGLENVIEPGDSVVVKPNLVEDADAERGITTDPRVTRAVVRLAQEAGAGQVVIAEGSASRTGGCKDRRPTPKCFHECGYDVDRDMVDDVTHVPLIDLNDAGGLDQHDPYLVREVHLQNGLIWSSYWLPRAILDADVLISVPVLKNHTHTGVTLALKNQFGLAPLDIYHTPGDYCWKGALSHDPDDLGRHIVDLNLARPLDFVVLDGLRGVIDGQFGHTITDPPLGLILAGSDPVAVDTLGALVMGYDPVTIPHLNWAAGAGLGTTDVSLITVGGLRVGQVRRDFPAPYGDVQAQRADAVAPTIAIETPSTGSVVTGEAIVWAIASDNDAVSKVEFYAGDELQAVVTSPPYQATLDLGAYRGQSVVLRGVAYDYALNDAEDSRVVEVIEAPAPGAASIQTATISISTYPYAGFLHDRTDLDYNITYRSLDWDAYEDSNPVPSLQDYTALVLENDYLQATLLPELGGRVYQMIFKPTGHNELYQNPVIKPTHWGPPEQGWWLAVGGIEWGLPVDEHGYEWGEPWSYQIVAVTDGVTVTLRDTTATDRIRAVITLYLPADRGYLAVTPRIENPTASDIDYKYWTNAMLTPGEPLAPGATNTVSGDLHFVFEADQVTVHSSGDFDEYDVLDWPVHSGTDYSRLGNWNHWLGFFERPAAQGDFAGVYDTAADEGVARVFPSGVARGSKGFGFGWANPIGWDNWTDDGSTYVELHGGVAPTFWDTATITSGQALEWTEYWYPLSDVGQLNAATAEAALGVRESGDSFHVGVHSTVPRAAGATTLYVWDRGNCGELACWDLPAISPEDPFAESVATEGRALEDVAFVYADSEENLLAAVNFRDCLPPASSVGPLPLWVATTSFAVTWSGQDAWSEVAAYDVQVRDGYEGAWTDWRTGTLATSGTFYGGVHGHTYFFRSRARDTFGNQEPYGAQEWGQAFTTVLTEPAPVLVTSRKSAAPQQPAPDQVVEYTVFISNTGTLSVTAVLTDTPPVEMVVLTETLVASSGPAPAYAGGQIRWSGVVEAGAAARVTYTLSPTPATPLGVPLTNTAEIAGSVLGPITRQESVVRMCLVWLPLVMRMG